MYLVAAPPRCYLLFRTPLLTFVAPYSFGRPRDDSRGQVRRSAQERVGQSSTGFQPVGILKNTAWRMKAHITGETPMLLCFVAQRI